MSLRNRLSTLTCLIALSLAAKAAHAQVPGLPASNGLFDSVTNSLADLTMGSTATGLPYGSTFGEGDDYKYPVFFSKFSTFRYYERMEKDVFRSRAKREMAANYLDAAEARYALKKLNREYRDSRRAPRVSTINVQASPEPIVSASELVTLLHRPVGAPEWPSVFRYAGFDDERLRLEQLLSLENLDQAGLKLAADLLVRLESKLQEYRHGDVVITPGDYLAGRRFLAAMHRQMMQPPATPEAPANSVAVN